MHTKNPWISFFLFLSDFFASLSAVVAAVVLRHILPFGGKAYLPMGQYVNFVLVSVPLLLLTHTFSGQYQRRRGTSLFIELGNTVRQVLFAMMTVLALMFFYREYQFSRLFVAYFFAVAVLFTFSGRMIIRIGLRMLRRAGYNLEHILFAGDRRRIAEFRNELESTPGFGFRVRGELYFGEEEGEKSYTPGRLVEMIRTVLPHELYIVPAQHHGKDEQMAEILELCDREGIRVRVVPDIDDFLTGNGQLNMLGRWPVVDISVTPLDLKYNRVLKRLFDLGVGLFLTAVSLPLMALIALLIRLTSRGPVFFSQERVGYNHKPFRIYKFRTMVQQPVEQSDRQWTVAGDARLTAVGKLLRKSSLDELPQLFNVLFGDMSLVGPRPERPFFVEEFRKSIPEYMSRHLVKAGITGWAQVLGLRGDTSIEKRVQADLYYIKNWSPGLDIKILFLTVLKGLLGKNAY